MPGAADGVQLAPVEAGDRAAILSILERSGLFRSSEISVALEVLDIALFREGQSDYIVHTARSGGRARAWICFGPNTMTEGTFELYWIAVDPDRYRCGLGRLLLEHAVDTARAMKGRLLVAETSSREDYEGTRSFYRRLGFREDGRVRGYYAPGDDKVFFVKDL